MAVSQGLVYTFSKGEKGRKQKSIACTKKQNMGGWRDVWRERASVALLEDLDSQLQSIGHLLLPSSGTHVHDTHSHPDMLTYK